jgi:hypothetical protein
MAAVRIALQGAGEEGASTELLDIKRVKIVLRV